jgi:hypothetical protein
LLSIVENLYRTGGKILLADPLSRLCAPGDGFYDISLPGKVGELLQNLPQQVVECNAMRVSANKDTAAVARMVQKWRKPTNPISQGKLSSYQEPKQQRDDDEETALTMVVEASEAGANCERLALEPRTLTRASVKYESSSAAAKHLQSSPRSLSSSR